MAVIQTDPENAEATFELGEIYFLGGEWQASIDWYTKLLELEPTNIVALIDVGTAQFQLANYEEAKASWLKAGEVDPNEVQVHYNLGYFYATVEPVDYAAALNEWQAVIDLAPGSDLAEVAQVHLESLTDEASAEASPVPTEAPRVIRIEFRSNRDGDGRRKRNPSSPSRRASFRSPRPAACPWCPSTRPHGLGLR
jgi:tetratricopeptide (TPR) repeat protein